MTNVLGVEDFKLFYPQFKEMPAIVLSEYISLANDTVDPAIWLEWTKEGRRLLVAHKCTLYLKASEAFNGDTNSAIAAGMAQGAVTSESVGPVSVSYGQNEANQGLTGWGDLKTTEYGIQYLTYARRLTLGVYVV